MIPFAFCRPPGLPSARRLALAVALAAAAGAPASSAQTTAEPLTLEAAVQAATSQSRRLAADRLQTQAARELAVAAGERPDPVLTLGVTNLPVNGPERYTLGQDFMTMRSVGVMQEFTRADKRRARAALAERRVDAALAAQRLSAAELQQAAALAWLDGSFEASLRELLAGQRARAALEVEAAESLYRSGQGTQADVFMARSQVEMIEDRIAQAERGMAVAQARLARWIGDAAERPLAPRPALARPAWAAGDVGAQVAGQPALAAALQQEAIAHAEAEVARSEKRADWSVELMFSQRGSAYSDMASINLSVPLQWRQDQRQERELAARLALVEQARAEREDLQREREAEVRALLAEWRSFDERLRHHDEALLPLAEQRSAAVLSAYRGGTGSLPAVLEARRAAVEVHVDRLDLEAEQARLWARLEFLSPRPSDGEAALGTASNASNRSTAP